LFSAEQQLGGKTPRKVKIKIWDFKNLKFLNICNASCLFSEKKKDKNNFLERKAE
jgi:hypothetical protein